MLKDDVIKAVDVYGEQQYNIGRLQGIWDFYNELKKTHETPDEIYDKLIHSEKSFTTVNTHVNIHLE